MTFGIEQLPDGRLSIESLDNLTTISIIELIRQFNIQHMVWRAPLDRNLAAYVGNFGVTFQIGEKPSEHLREIAPQYVLIVGK